MSAEAAGSTPAAAEPLEVAAMSYAVPEREGEGWLLFASIVLITGGIMRLFDALWAFDKDDELAGDLQVLLFDDDLAAYGWAWLAVGILLIAAGFGVLSRSPWARWFGIFMASIGAITSMLWIYAFPIWSLVGIVISFSVIYALATYGGRPVGAVRSDTGADRGVHGVA